MWTKGRFSICDSVDFPGYAKEGENWNGWACPAFTKTTCIKILKDRPNLRWHYDRKTDAFLVSEVLPEEFNDNYMGFDIKIGKKTVHVYAVGAFAWVWDEVEQFCR